MLFANFNSHLAFAKHIDSRDQQPDQVHHVLPLDSPLIANVRLQLHYIRVRLKSQYDELLQLPVGFLGFFVLQLLRYSVERLMQFSGRQLNVTTIGIGSLII